MYAPIINWITPTELRYDKEIINICEQIENMFIPEEIKQEVVDIKNIIIKSWENKVLVKEPEIYGQPKTSKNKNSQRTLIRYL